MFAFSGLLAMSNLGINLRDPLLRFLLRINVSNIIGGVYKVVRGSLDDFISLEFSTQAAEDFFPPDLLSGLRSCLQVALFLRSCLEDFFRILLFRKRFIVLWGVWNYWRDWSAPAINFLGSLIAAFLSCRSAANKVFWSLIPYIWWDYFGGRLYSS